MYPTWLPKKDAKELCESNLINTCHCSLDDIRILRPLPESGSFDSPVFLLVIGTWDTPYPREETERVYGGLLVQSRLILSSEEQTLVNSWNVEFACVRIGVGILFLTSTGVKLPEDCMKTVAIF